MITVFTPTYNRGYILPKLYESLKRQTCLDFEWIVIDDNSSDNTNVICKEWVSAQNPFEFRYFRLNRNGGKQRAINQAVKLAQYAFFFIVDSDDYLTDDAIEKVEKWCEGIKEDESFVGVSGIRCRGNGDYIIKPDFQGNLFIDCTYIERLLYHLDADMAEIYKTEVLKRYEFPVWHDETFTPEDVVWDQMALDGYKIRYYDEKIYVCEYLNDGLTKGGNKLYYKNLMGTAMVYNIKLKHTASLLERYKLIREILVCCCLKHDFSYLRKTCYPVATYLLLPIGYLFYLRRKRLFKNL